MKYFVIATLLAAALSPAISHAETITLAPGSFEISDDFQVLDRNEKLDPKTGKMEGLIVFSRKDELPKAVFIVTYLGDKDSTTATDFKEVAVKIGNPFDPALTSKDAQDVTIGGVAGGRYVGTLSTGKVVRSYVAANNGYRLIVLLKGPAGQPYSALMDKFGNSIEHFTWQPAQVSATVASAK